jgi:tRNA(Arg) A34 adenosine deaminase TadA
MIRPQGSGGGLRCLEFELQNNASADYHRVTTAYLSEEHSMTASFQRSRRELLRAAAVFTGAGATLLAAQTASPIESGSDAKRKAFMQLAFDMRQRAVAAGDQPYGAVLVKDERVVGEGPSEVITRGDPTAHAEMQAIRDAARRLQTRDLSGCVMFASSKPCAMCETAAYWANVSLVYHGGDVEDGQRPRYAGCG